jgi:AraC-like DNA-binding protein
MLCVDETMSSVVVEGVEAQPTGALDGLIRRCGGFRHEGLAPGVHVVAASAHVKVIIGFGPSFEYVTMSESGQAPAAFHTFVVGPHAVPAAVRHEGTQSAVEVEIPPIRLRSLLGLSAGDIGAAVIELEDLIGRRARWLGDDVRTAPTWDDRFRAIEGFISGHRRDVAIQSEVDFAWQRVRASGGRESVDSLAKAVGWSERQLLRRFRAEVGLSPKVAARITRFECAEQLLSRSVDPRLADVAAACGYFDQSHLANEWRVLAGSPINTFRERV